MILKQQQADDELCQTQVKLRLAKLDFILLFIENWGHLPFAWKNSKCSLSSILLKVKAVFSLHEKAFA